MRTFLALAVISGASCCALWANIPGGGGGPATGPGPTSGPNDPIVGVFDGFNCYPFSCAPTDGRTAYQQVYSSTAFTGPINIGDLEFFQGIPGQMDNDTYSVYLSYSANPVNGLSSTSPAANIGADYSYFGSYAIGGTMPPTLTLNGNTFDYNPAMGDLLMTVYITEPPTGFTYSSYPGSYFQADGTGLVTSRAYFGGPYGNGADSTGLVTGFSAATATVPEPASVILLASFAGLTLLAFRRKRLANRT